MTAYLFDLDGTLCDGSHRQHFLQQTPPDWPAFFAACGGDAPTALVTEALRLQASGARLVFLTGRPESVRAQTAEWLARHGFEAAELHMRPAGDFTKAPAFKARVVGKMIAAGRTFAAAYDDEPAVLEALAGLGIEGRLA